MSFLAKIAIEVERALSERDRNGAAGHAAGRLLASGDGWSVADVVCTLGPHDRPFEERHANVAIALVVAGSFQYRSRLGSELMTPGALMLGNPGHVFECGHEHGAGDRCISFSYAPDHFERLAADARSASRMFPALRLPPRRAMAPLVARACAGLTRSNGIAWEELAVTLAVRTMRLVGDAKPSSRPDRTEHIARVTQAVRAIERCPDGSHTLASLARDAGLSVYHFLRIFEQQTGLTPHQFVLRARLREAAVRLVVDRARILDVALDSGFGDVSNFNRAFRAEFGLNPRAFRRAVATNDASTID